MKNDAPSKPASRRTPLIDVLRAVAALVIAWHHFALYGPLSDWARPVAENVLYFVGHYARATQIFFVVGGYVLARSMTRRNWNLRRVGRYVVHRYLRLGLPYLGAIALAILACHFGRDLLPEKTVGPHETWREFGVQLLAHLFFLQNILGYESFSAGLWFVCINFQLSLVFVAMLWLRDAATPNAEGAIRWPSAEPADPEAENRFGPTIFTLLGWGMAAIALFYFNRDHRWDVWFIYFFAHFYLGVVVYQSLSDPRKHYLFWLYVFMVLAAIVVDCLYVVHIEQRALQLRDIRWRLVTTLVSGVILFVGGRLGFMDTWPKSRVLDYLGRTSYSLFLIHFPVLVAVATVWTWLDWRNPWQALAGLGFAYLLSLIVADVFYRLVESPSARLSRNVRY